MTAPRTPDYDPHPVIEVPGTALRGADLWHALDADARARGGERPVIVLDTYPATDTPGLVAQALAHLPGYTAIDVEEAALPVSAIDALIGRHLTDDRVFGVLAPHRLAEFYDPDALDALTASVAAAPGPLLVHGWGAALAAPARAVLALVDLARWEIQQRYRGGTPNWRCPRPEDDVLRAYKRGFFVEWRVADAHKRGLFDRLDWVLDGNASEPVGLSGADFRAGMASAARRPFRLVPYFDQGVWGGHWMQERFGLPAATNYAWCFDCVPEENSIVLRLTGGDVELPAIDLVLSQPDALLGRRTHARFGAEFPIRFDFLDTMGGQNLSLQVHPSTDYIQRTFGMHYTQDESYYLLDAAPGAQVYLGLREDADPEALRDALRRAEAGAPFEADAFVNSFPAAKHDHFLIPAGTVHCSGADAMVLEISATPFIFTFKMWDWDRLGLDGRPRPVHLDHAFANIDWSRRTAWVERELVDRVVITEEGEGWRREVTGLHELEFIETTRTWFTGPIEDDTHGTVHVLNLVEGGPILLESPTGAFAPFAVHYAETFVVPAAVGRYRARPLAEGAHAVLRAHVRGTETD